MSSADPTRSVGPGLALFLKVTFVGGAVIVFAAGGWLLTHTTRPCGAFPGIAIGCAFASVLPWYFCRASRRLMHIAIALSVGSVAMGVISLRCWKLMG